jgi:hypothetical protein
MKKSKFKKAARIIILIAAVLFITVGVMREEQRIVLNEAVNICLDCIGIG